MAALIRWRIDWAASSSSAPGKIASRTRETRASFACAELIAWLARSVARSSKRKVAAGQNAVHPFQILVNRLKVFLRREGPEPEEGPLDLFCRDRTEGFFAVFFIGRQGHWKADLDWVVAAARRPVEGEELTERLAMRGEDLEELQFREFGQFDGGLDTC